MAIGKDLADVAFSDLVHNLALAIADGQLQLDRSAIQTLDYLVKTQVSVVPEITDIITSVPRSVVVPGTGEVINYSGAQVVSSGAAPVPMSLLQAGITPTFYQFTEASIEIKLSVTVKEDTAASSASRGPVRPFKVHASPVDFRTSNTYSYTAQGSSSLKATMKPIPAPSRLTPRSIMVDATVQPPRVTIVG